MCCRVEGHLVGTTHRYNHILVHSRADITRLIAIFCAIGNDIAVIAGAGHTRPAG